MKRNSTIECIRVLAIVSVIFGHVKGYTVPSTWHETVEFHLSDSALVFFFVISGYYWGRKIRAGNPVGQVYADYSLRILKIFVLWSLVYILISRGGISEYTRYGVLSPLKVCYWNLLHVVERQGPLWRGVLYILLTGTKYHLWFLMALVWAATITAILVKWKRESWLVWVGITLYTFEALSRFLSATSNGFSLPFNARYGPFFGTIFFVIGWRLSSRQGTFTLKPAIGLISMGLAALVVDLLVVPNHLGFRAVQPFLETTVGVGAALLALARPSLGVNTILASMGQYVLGIYLIHPAFIDLLRPYDHDIFLSHVLGLSFPAMVFLISALTVMILQKPKALSPFVTTSRTPD
jgi:surface polysaccharide O-acyltransferase-like enzyme